jgi:hypothetical protein
LRHIYGHRRRLERSITELMDMALIAPSRATTGVQTYPALLSGNAKQSNHNNLRAAVKLW